MLFEPMERTDQDIKGHGETDWQYLDRSGREEAQRVRDLLNSWLAAYPEAHQVDLVSRIQGGDDTEFQAAAFELLLYSTLRGLGFDIEVHPQLPTGTKRPDFLATTPQGDAVYVEAVLASEFSQEAKSARRRTKVVLDAIEKVDSPDFFISVSARGDPQTPPNGKRLRRNLQTWIASLDHAAVAALEHSAWPKYLWEYEGWKIKFGAIPKKADRRGQGQRTIGAIFGGARWGASHLAIRDAVKTKGGRYGVLPNPLLVAVNVDAMSVSNDDEMNALFGDEQYIVRMDDRSATPRMQRAPNGTWIGAAGPQYTRVSGAWIFRNATPWNFTSRTQTVYFNPFAASPLPASFDVLPHAKGVDGVLEWTDGRALHEVLGLPKEWPESS